MTPESGLPFFDGSIRFWLVILVGGWNAVLNPDIYRTGTRLDTNNPDVKPYRNFIDRLDHVDKLISLGGSLD